jgi:transcriptional regulator with XRE-family HTH domain
MLTKVRKMIVGIFGTVLRELREKNNLSQEKLAEFCDLDRTYISLLERGLRQPTVTTLFRLAKALKIKPSDLIVMVEAKLSDKL